MGMNKILVLGAGYAGVMTAKHLDKIGDPFTLVSMNEYHHLTTLLHEAAGGRMETDEYAVPITSVLQRASSRLVVDEVIAIDRENRVVQVQGGELLYDWLVVALGWIPDYFGIPGLRENALTLTNLSSATRIREHIVNEFIRYGEDKDPNHLSIAILGAGLTGIELVGEVLDFVSLLCIRFGVDRGLVQVHTVEATPEILPQVSDALRGVARRVLEEKGAKLHTNTRIVRLMPGVVWFEDGSNMSAGTVVWTGGVRANPLLEAAGLTVDRKGRAKVNEFLQSVDDERVFVGGDCSWYEQDGRPLPTSAQLASQMGRTIAHNVHSISNGHTMNMFRPKLQGTLASLGREVGIGDVGKIRVSGMPAGLLKEATKVKYMWQLGGLRLATTKGVEIVHL